MDLNELKNLNMDDLKAKVLAFADKKTLIKIGVSLGSIIFFLIIYYSILNPIVNAKKAKLSDMNLKEQEIAEFNKDIKSKKRKIKKLTPEYNKYSTLFHTKAEVEGLYQTLSQFAGENGLVISKIQKGKSVSVTKDAALDSLDSGKKKKKKKKAKKKKKKSSKKNVAYYKIPVTFEISGNFIGYIKFKRAISLSHKMLNFDKETIKVVKGNSTGTIKVNGTLTVVGLADDFS